MSDSKDSLGSSIHPERASLSCCKFCSIYWNDFSSRLSNMGCQTLRHHLRTLSIDQVNYYEVFSSCFLDLKKPRRGHPKPQRHHADDCGEGTHQIIYTIVTSTCPPPPELMQNFADNLPQLSMGITGTLTMGQSHAQLEKCCGELQMKDLSNSEHYTSETIFFICVNISKPGLRERERKKEEKPLITTDLGGIKSKLQH